MLRKTVVITLRKKRKSCSPSHTIIEDTIRHNIAQMTSTSKAKTSLEISVNAMMAVAKDNKTLIITNDLQIIEILEHAAHTH